MSMDHLPSLQRVWDSALNAAPEQLRGTVDESYRQDCFARWMLKNWSRAKITEWLDKNPNQAEAMRQRLNNQRAKR